MNTLNVQIENVNVAKLSKSTAKIVNSILTNKDKVNELPTLAKIRLSNNIAKIQGMSLSKVHKAILSESKGILTAKQIDNLCFKNIVTFVDSSQKYKGQQLFTANDVVLIMNAVLKQFDGKTKVEEKVRKQGGKITAKK
jgi:hypothetical protein